MTYFRVYETSELDREGYPPEWDSINGGIGIKHLVRAAAGDRCQRCMHPYVKGMGEWSPCDVHCEHGMPARCLDHPFEGLGEGATTGGLLRDAEFWDGGRKIEAQWRVLTVHHLNEVKLDCRWWNLVALCQRCHLLIQRKVNLDTPWPWPHTPWFKPYAAGFYALKYAGVDLTREEVGSDMEKWLALGARHEAFERMPL